MQQELEKFEGIISNSLQNFPIKYLNPYINIVYYHEVVVVNKENFKLKEECLFEILKALKHITKIIIDIVKFKRNYLATTREKTDFNASISRESMMRLKINDNDHVQFYIVGTDDTYSYNFITPKGKMMFYNNENDSITVLILFTSILEQRLKFKELMNAIEFHPDNVYAKKTIEDIKNNLEKHN
jgi:AICAR transformylase/IMP cyclohydrolase PurH